VELNIDTVGDMLPPHESPPSTPIQNLSQTQLFTVPSFSHGPHPSIRGCHCWPSAPNAQGISTLLQCPLHNVLVLITPFLDEPSFRQTFCLSKTFTCGVIGTPLSFTWPWSPYRGRLWGFGIPSKDRSATHDSPSAIGMLHHIWPFLQPEECLATHSVCMEWRSYIDLRIDACCLLVAEL
jgi:hypothetical protein